jgi:nuclear pore complex protein Nup93
MQILAGMFEKAVADLYPHNYVSAVHFAIALDYYGFLRVSDPSNSDDLLTYTSRQQPQIAFGSMIGLYTRDFRTADATMAVDYLTLICLNGDLTGDLGKKQRELCHQALTEVVLETREFAQLLGDIRADGQRIKGAIEQRLKLIGLENEQDFLKHITLVAARTAEEQSRVTDAALLFHLAEDYDKVIQVVNEAVSLALTTELGEQPTRLTPLKPRTTQTQDGKSKDDQQSSLSLTAVDDPVDLAQNMITLYRGHEFYYKKMKATTLDSCQILLQLAQARNALEQGNWPEVIDVSPTVHSPTIQTHLANNCRLQDVTNSRLLPTEAGGNMSAIRATAQAFNQLPTTVARTVGYVMLWTVIACSNNVEKLKAAEFETGAQQETIRRCIQTSKDVMVFAGLIRFKLPGRVWEALARVGGDLGAY